MRFTAEPGFRPAGGQESLPYRSAVTQRAPKRGCIAAPGLSSRTPAALRPRVRTSPPAYPESLPDSPPLPHRGLRRDAGAKTRRRSRCGIASAPSHLPRAVRRSLRRGEPSRTSFALRCGDCSLQGRSVPALRRWRRSKLRLNTVAAPRRSAIAGNARIPGPLPAGRSCRNRFQRGCLLPPGARRSTRSAAGTACSVPRTRCALLPTASALVLRSGPGNRFPGLFRLSPASGRNRRWGAALTGAPFRNRFRSGSPSPLRLPEQAPNRLPSLARRTRFCGGPGNLVCCLERDA